MTAATAERDPLPECALPVRRYLSATEASAYIGVSVDTFRGLDIDYVDLGERSRRWDLSDIHQFMHSHKRNGSAPTDRETGKEQSKCNYTGEKEAAVGMSLGTTRAANVTEEVLELPTRSKPKH